jgi:hypothetical protein
MCFFLTVSLIECFLITKIEKLDAKLSAGIKAGLFFCDVPWIVQNEILDWETTGNTKKKA